MSTFLECFTEMGGNIVEVPIYSNHVRILNNLAREVANNSEQCAALVGSMVRSTSALESSVPDFLSIVTRVSWDDQLALLNGAHFLAAEMLWKMIALHVAATINEDISPP